ncbi:MAG: hypothetical protein ACREOC_19015 [Gemmatimonadales bacterium]
MRSTRRSDLQGLLISLLLGLSLLVPGAGHAIAHHHAAEHDRSTDLADYGHSGSGSHVVMTGGHSDADHPHLDLLAVPSAKPLLVHAIVVRAMALVLDDVSVERPLPLGFTTGLSPGARGHGPPPPSRAPPQV